MTSRHRGDRQLSFADRRRKDGKARKRPGRKPSKLTGVPHIARPVHKRWNPVHVTLRAVAGLASFRTQITYRAFERAVRDTRREDFRIAEFSIQVDHVHLIVETNDKDAMARGMKAFSVRANRLFNAASGRKRGTVWRSRYHRTDLTTPRQVRNALVYCLNNARKHGAMGREPLRIDACSSARWFAGWSVPRTTAEPIPPPTQPARTMLLRALWRKARAPSSGRGASGTRHLPSRSVAEHRVALSTSSCALQPGHVLIVRIEPLVARGVRLLLHTCLEDFLNDERANSRRSVLRYRAF